MHVTIVMSDLGLLLPRTPWLTSSDGSWVVIALIMQTMTYPEVMLTLEVQSAL